MPKRKPRKRKYPKDPNNKDAELFDKIRDEVKGHPKEGFVRRIITKLAINPKLSNLWFSLGLLLSEAEKYDTANLVFDKVVKLNPDHKKLWTSKANVLVQMGRKDEASECYKKSLESFTGQLDGYNNLMELLDEIKERKGQLGLEEFDDESIEFLATNILDLDSFISELEILAGQQGGQGASEAIDGLSSKLDELESMGSSSKGFWSNLLGLKKNDSQ
jgi:tetratricopeptide (TPR) repeat protein